MKRIGRGRRCVRRPSAGPPPETNSPGSKARRPSFVPRPGTRTSTRSGFGAIGVVPTGTRSPPQPSRSIRSGSPARRRLRPPLPPTFASWRCSFAPRRGALEQVGGQYIQERARQAREAVAAVEERERELDLDYGAWRLLQEALVEAEQEEAVHLGKALVPPVSERVAALTGGRYGELAIGPQLDAAGIQTAGVERKFDVLSVGTQEQIALLLRLSIAEAPRGLHRPRRPADAVRPRAHDVDAGPARSGGVPHPGGRDDVPPGALRGRERAPPRGGPVELRAATHACRDPTGRWLSARVGPAAG